MPAIRSNEVIWKNDGWKFYYDSGSSTFILEYTPGGITYEFGESGTLITDGLDASSLNLGNDITAGSITSDDLIANTQMGPPSYSGDGSAPANSLFYHSGDERIKFKDGTGTVHTPAEYLANEDATYITTSSESGLSNSTQHANLSGGDLHSPASHDDSAHDYHDRFNFSQSHTLWEDGLSNEEIFRYSLDTGESFHLDRVEFRQKGGGSSADASLDVYDETNATALDSTTLGSTSTGGGSSGDGNVVIIRVSNSTGAAIEANLTVSGTIQ